MINHFQVRLPLHLFGLLGIGVQVIHGCDAVAHVELHIVVVFQKLTDSRDGGRRDGGGLPLFEQVGESDQGAELWWWRFRFCGWWYWWQCRCNSWRFRASTELTASGNNCKYECPGRLIKSVHVWLANGAAK